MKLSGPVPRIEFILDRVGMRVHIGGIFPPELAPQVRAIAEARIPSIEPVARDAWDRAKHMQIHHTMYGTGEGEPRGVLHVDPPTKPVCKPRHPSHPRSRVN